jgi:hypothetical protein
MNECCKQQLEELVDFFLDQARALKRSAGSAATYGGECICQGQVMAFNRAANEIRNLLNNG